MVVNALAEIAPTDGASISCVPQILVRSPGLDGFTSTSLDFDPFDRMLLTTDGTVTSLLEACTAEPIVTRTMRQSGPAPLERLRAATGCWWHPDAGLLELEPGERVIARRVTLTGAHSGIAYVRAEALVVPDRLPELIAHRLLRAGASLGRLLAAGLRETRRDIREIVDVRAGADGDDLAVPGNATLARRTYTIDFGRNPVAAVTEWLVPGRLTAAALGHRNETGRRAAGSVLVR